MNISTSQKGSSPLVILLLIAVLAVLVGVLYFMFGKEVTSVVQKGVDKVEEEVETDPVDVVYKKKNDIYLLYSSGKTQKVDAGTRGVNNFYYDHKSKLLVYVSGDVQVTEYAEYVKPDAASIYNVKTGENKEIYKLEYKLLDDGQHSIHVNDIGISEDGEKVAVTTNDSVFVYDVKSGQINKVFTLPGSPDEQGQRGGVYGLSKPVFSPDKSKIAVMKGYYEGASDALIDVVSGLLTDLPYQSYISGQRVHSWKDKETLLVIDYVGPGAITGEEEASSKIATAKVSSPKDLTTLASSAGTFYDVSLRGDKAYVVINETKQHYSDEFQTVLYENYYSIKELNLTNGVGSEFYRVKERVPERGYEVSYYRIKVSPDGKRLYLLGSTRKPSEAGTNKIFVMDVEKPGEPRELFDADFL